MHPPTLCLAGGMQKNIKKPKRQKEEKMSKKDCFNDVLTLFKGYENTKRGLTAENEKLKKTGMYSRKFLSDADAEMDKKLRDENSRIISRIMVIREKLSKELDAEFDLTATKPDSSLQALVNSGIVPTKKEFINLAQKYKGNYVNSRLLHDFADKSGYILRNITTREEAEQAFENFVRGVTHSMYCVSGFPVYSDSGIAKIKADGYLYNLDNPALDCYKKPETFEESVAQELEMGMVDEKRITKEPDDDAFLRGFWGTDKKQNSSQNEDQEKLEDEIKTLSDEEIADAKYHSMFNGRHGEITQEEIDFIHSKRYKEIIEERKERAEKKVQANE